MRDQTSRTLTAAVAAEYDRVMHRLFPTALVLLSATAASASPFDLYGAGARGSAMGGAQTASAEGPEAVHYNVSQLADAPVGLSIGVLATYGNAQILLKERPPGYEVPDLGPPATSLGDELILRERVDTALDTPLAGLSIGAVSGVIFDGLQAGILVFLPVPTPVTLATTFSDERERYFSNQLQFERIGPRVHQIDLEFGLAYEVTEWLSAGVGAAYLPGFSVNTGIYLPDSTDQSAADVNANISTENGFGLLAGLTVRLPQNIEVAASFRDAVALRLSSDNELQLNGITNGEPIQQVANWTPIYSPGIAALGAAWSPGDWTLSADVRYTLWSGYEDGQGRVAGFNNVLSGAVGAEWRYTETTALRVGAGFEPSPVPKQDGRFNYVDNDRLNLSLGAGHSFAFGDTKFDVAWHVRMQGLLKRETIKAELDDYPECGPDESALCDEIPDDLQDPVTGQPYPEAQGLQTGNPGFPGWVSGGWIGSLGVELRY